MTPPSTVHHPHSRPISIDSSITIIKQIATYVMDIAKAVGFGKKEYLDIKEAVTATILHVHTV